MPRYVNKPFIIIIIRYGATCEINDILIYISDILIYMFITEKNVEISTKLKVEMSCMT